MNPAMWISKTGLQAQDEQLQTIANNLANANTVGFKRDRAVFADLSYQVERQPGAQNADGTVSPTGVQLGNGTRLVGTQKDFTAGSTQTTGQPFDLAINGQGFLQIETANGETAYTRAGQLQLNAQGQLVTSTGLLLTPAITIPANTTAVTIGQNGVVTATVAGKTAPAQVGQITLATFPNPAGLVALGNNLFQETDASGPPTVGVPGADAFGTIQQGSLEGSNVSVVEEMVNMIAAQRTYEMSTKVLSSADNMLQLLSQAAH
ncbi:MAG: flagellar basal-body rod protein FlgG [Steroidobacteraceae bacterium]